MKTVHTILREDFGQLDRHLVRTELLAEAGVCGVDYELARNGLCIAYDPAVLTATKLADLMCRHGVYPDAGRFSADAPKRSDNEARFAVPRHASVPIDSDRDPAGAEPTDSHTGGQSR